MIIAIVLIHSPIETKNKVVNKFRKLDFDS